MEREQMNEVHNLLNILVKREKINKEYKQVNWKPIVK